MHVTDADTALIGQTVDAIPTPALVVEVDLLDANLARMAGYFAARPSQLRPHFKAHKCVTLARRQLAAGGAVGITAAKLSEAEQLVAGGVGDVLIANQVIGAAKAARLAELNRQAVVRVAVDDPGNIAELGVAARAAGVTIGVLVEIDIGMGRSGVTPDLAPELAQLVAVTKGLRFDGLQGYEGHLVTFPDPEERRVRVTAAMQPLLDVRARLAATGLPVTIISGGGSGTYDITGDIAGIDEVQAGSYALMDAKYRTVRPEFAVARGVLTTVVSAQPGRGVTDVGTKGLGGEFGLPEVDGAPGATVRKTAEEHTVIEGLAARVGDLVRLVPSHGCTTNNLYRKMWITRAGIIEEVWAIEGSGCLE